jgi:hypothetical protein
MCQSYLWTASGLDRQIKLTGIGLGQPRRIAPLTHAIVLGKTIETSFWAHKYLSHRRVDVWQLPVGFAVISGATGRHVDGMLAPKVQGKVLIYKVVFVTPFG